MSENLLDLVKTIRDRKNKDEDKSYTSSLLSGGLTKCIDKMQEEFGELTEALNDNSNVVHEAADTIYHLLVTLEVANIKFEDVLKELENRKNQSGIEEKNNRKWVTTKIIFLLKSYEKKFLEKKFLKMNMFFLFMTFGHKKKFMRL